MSPPRVLLAVLAGCVLATFPFLRYAHVGGGEAHANHEARHGGQLGMVGEHHLELVRRDGRVEVYVSDAWRKPLRPTAGVLRLDRGTPAPLVWESHRLTAPDRDGAHEAEVSVRLDDGTDLALGFDLAD